jgi:hypothetical protein
MFGLPEIPLSPLASHQNVYKIFNEFKGPVFFVLSDPEGPLKTYPEHGLFVTREDTIVLSQSWNLPYLQNRWSRVSDSKCSFVRFPFEQFPMMFKRPELVLDPECDLSYGGQVRFGKRSARLYESYYNAPSDIDVMLFGTISTVNLEHQGYKITRSPRFEPSVQANKILLKMSQSICHYATCDIEYELLGLLPQRVYEGVAARTFVFVDERLGKGRKQFSADPEVQAFAYIKSPAELYDKIRALKSDLVARAQMIEAQDKSVQFNAKEYGESLISTMGMA